MSDPLATSPAAPYAIWAIAVMVLGWLLAIGSGLCGGIFVISGIADSSGYGGAMVMGGLIMGGVPCFTGVGIILAARKWGRRKPGAPHPDVFT